MSDEMVVRENAGVTYRQATDVAGMCKQIVLQTAIEIQHRKYVRVEGWQAIAVAHGCIASSKDVEHVAGGIRAIGEVRRGTDGVVLSTAEGFVGDDEETWGKRPEYAKRAMAQTRAISRACRSAFAHVVVLMNANLETTPAEEVPLGGFTNDVTVRPKAAKPLPADVARPVKPLKPQPDDSPAEPVISLPQQKRLFAIADKAGVTADTLHGHLLKKYGIEHSKDIERRSYEAICAWAFSGGQTTPEDQPDTDEGRKDGNPY